VDKSVNPVFSALASFQNYWIFYPE